MAKISFYFDEMLSRKAAEQLIEQGYDVIIAVDVAMSEKSDPEHLAYASEHDRVLVTFDRPFAGKTLQLTEHAGLICLSGSQDNVGFIVRILAEFVDTHTPEEAAGHVFWF